MRRNPEAFWQAVSEHFLKAGALELDATLFIEWGLEHGLLAEAIYDPALHGYEIDGDPAPGELIYVTVPPPTETWNPFSC